MAEIGPFICVRPAEALASRVAALPYDVYNRAEAKTETQREPLSFLAIDRAETGLPDTVDTYADEVYERARALYQARLADGTFLLDPDRCYYLYELTMNGRSQTGIVAAASIDDYINGVILRHENTREDKEIDRIRHVDTLSAQTGPIFLAFRDAPALTELIARIRKTETPLYSFVSPDGIGHRVFKAADPADIRAIHEAFAGISSIYIADGHHRAASAVKVGLKRRQEHPGYTGEEEFNYFLSVLFPASELAILPYNRVVKDLAGLTPEAFLANVSEKFEIAPLAAADAAPVRKGTFGLYMDGSWRLLTLRKEEAEKRAADPVESLDVSVLQDLILAPVLKIADPRTDARIDFVGGIRGTGELMKRCGEGWKLAFSMYPTGIDELFAVADAGRLMPPKSTWFEPKLRSGLFIHEI